MSPYPGMTLAYMPHSGQVCLIPDEEFDSWACTVLCESKLHGPVRLEEVPSCYYVCPRCEQTYEDMTAMCQEVLRMHANVDLVIDVEAAALDVANTWMAYHLHPNNTWTDSHDVFKRAIAIITALIDEMSKTLDTDDTVV